MIDLSHPGVRELLAAPNHAVISTRNPDGSIASTVVWIDYVDGVLAVNSATGRRWPANLDRDPRVTVVVIDQQNPYRFAEIRGAAEGTLDGAREHIHALARKYTGHDFTGATPGEQRKRFVITAEKVRYVSD